MGGLFGLLGEWLEMGGEWEECSSRGLKDKTGLSKSKEGFLVTSIS